MNINTRNYIKKSFVKTKIHIREQANKAVFSLLKTIRTLNLTFDFELTYLIQQSKRYYYLDVRYGALLIIKI
jgi:hypothetical protein